MTDTETKSEPKAKPDESPVYDGVTFEAVSGGPTKIVLAGMFHADPSLVEAEKTETEWQTAIDEFLKSEPR